MKGNRGYRVKELIGNKGFTKGKRCTDTQQRHRYKQYRNMWFKHGFLKGIMAQRNTYQTIWFFKGFLMDLGLVSSGEETHWETPVFPIGFLTVLHQSNLCCSATHFQQFSSQKNPSHGVVWVS